MKGGFDWDAVVLAPNLSIFGETIAFAPALPGASAFGAIGAVDAGFVSVDPDSGQTVSSVRPRVGVRAQDMTIAGQVALGYPAPLVDFALPKQGDYVRVYRTGKYYRLKEAQPDSHGHIHYEMNVLTTGDDLTTAEAKFAAFTPV